MERFKRELGKLQLPTTGTKNELQRRLRKQLHKLQGIEIDFHEFENEKDQELNFISKIMLLVSAEVQELLIKHSNQIDKEQIY